MSNSPDNKIYDPEKAHYQSNTSTEQLRGSARWAGMIAGGIFGLFAGAAVAIGFKEPTVLLAIPIGTTAGASWGYAYGRMIEQFSPEVRV